MRIALLILLIGLFVSASIFGFLAWQDLQYSEVKIEWTTASEVNIAGFNLYRSDTQDGDFIKINPILIPTTQQPLIGGEYSYRDKNVTPGRIYYYILEYVNMDGSITRHGPMEAKASLLKVANLLASLSMFIMVTVFGVWMFTHYVKPGRSQQNQV